MGRAKKLTQGHKFRLLDQVSQRRAAEARQRGESTATAGLRQHDKSRATPMSAAKVYTKPTERKVQHADEAAAKAAADRAQVDGSELRLMDEGSCCEAMRLMVRTYELLQEQIRVNALIQGQSACLRLLRDAALSWR